MPAISVIIPIYNVEKFLRRCLDSVLNQTMGDWEAICVNDGSPDNSAEILKEYAARDKRFKIVTKENGGLSSARNAGMVVARGDYVLYLDSDDFIHPQLMEITYNLAQREKSDIVSFRKDRGLRTRLLIRQRFGRDIDNVIPAGLKKHYDADKVSFKTTDDVLKYATERTQRRRCWQIKHCYVWQNLYRRTLIADLQFIKGIIMEDYPWWSALMLRHPRVTITKLPFYYYIPNLNSILGSSKQLRIIDNIAIGTKYAYDIYKYEATSREIEIWQREFLWPFIIHSFRKVSRLDNTEDINRAKEIFTELYELGILNKQSSAQSYRYRYRILNFIKD